MFWKFIVFLAKVCVLLSILAVAAFMFFTNTKTITLPNDNVFIERLIEPGYGWSYRVCSPDGSPNEGSRVTCSKWHRPL